MNVQAHQQKWALEWVTTSVDYYRLYGLYNSLNLCIYSRTHHVDGLIGYIRSAAPTLETRMAISASRARLPVRLWNSYLSALQVRPIRTRVITSSILFFAGDLIAQLVIEDKKLVEPEQGSNRGWDVSFTLAGYVRGTY